MDDTEPDKVVLSHRVGVAAAGCLEDVALGAERTAAHAASTVIRAFVHNRLVPLPHVAALVKRAIGARRVLELANVGAVVRTADGENYVRHTPKAVVGMVAGVGVAVGTNGARRGVALGRIVPVTGVGCAAFVIGSLIPLILAGHSPLPSGVAPDSLATIAVVAVQSIGPGLSIAIALAVIEPVGETAGVPIAYVVHRPVRPVASHSVAVGVGHCAAPAALDVAAQKTRRIAHVRAVQPIRVTVTLGFVVQEIAILRGGDFILADVAVVAHGTVAGSGIRHSQGISHVARIADSHRFQVRIPVAQVEHIRLSGNT